MNRARDGWRPPVRLIVRSPVHLLAFGLGAGLSPVAPGTVGTLVGIPLWLLLAQGPPLTYGLATVALALLGCWLCGESARRLGVHDYGGIVFDEVIGYLIAAAPLLPVFGLTQPARGPALLIAFLAFRLFDVWKPWPIGWFDARVHGGLGIMIDDWFAGLFAAGLLWAVLSAGHHVGGW